MARLLNPPVTCVLLSVFFTRNVVQALRFFLSPVHNNWQLTYNNVCSCLFSGYSWTGLTLLGKMKEMFT